MAERITLKIGRGTVIVESEDAGLAESFAAFIAKVPSPNIADVAAWAFERGVKVRPRLVRETETGDV